MSAADCRGWGPLLHCNQNIIKNWRTFSTRTGTTKLLSCTSISQPVDGEEDNTIATSCNKDPGGKRRVQKWIRGVWFCQWRWSYPDVATSLRVKPWCMHEQTRDVARYTCT